MHGYLLNFVRKRLCNILCSTYNIIIIQRTLNIIFVLRSAVKRKNKMFQYYNKCIY